MTKVINDKRMERTD